jgi:hypothetical protein
MTLRLTKFGLEILGRSFSPISYSTVTDAVFPIIADNNWRNEVSDSCTWQTDVSRSKTTGAEERVSMCSRPARDFQVLLSGMSREESARMMMNALAMGKNPSIMPIYSDFATTTSGTAPGVKFLPCDTRYKRFYPGQRIAMVPADFSLVIPSAGNPLQLQMDVIDYIAHDGLHLVNGPAVQVVRSSLVFPMIDCELSLSQEITALTDGIIEWRLSYSELSGNSALPAQWDDNLRMLFPYYNGYPIFDMDSNWRDSVTIKIVRDGERNQQGKTYLVSPDGPASRFEFTSLYEQYERRDAWLLAAFFDSRRGRCYPFWLPNPQMMFTIYSVPSTTVIRVQPVPYVGALSDNFTHVAVTNADGSLSLHAVSSIDNTIDTYYEITLSEALSATTITDVTTAHLCRFSSDTLERKWVTDGICSSKVSMISLIDEADYAVT